VYFRSAYVFIFYVHILHIIYDWLVCMQYSDCTKPKGMEQRSRAECIPECKSKCATTKEQLMKGTPIAKE